MIRYECDACGEPMQANDPARFIVKMEVYASLNPLEDGLDDDDDQLLEIQEILERMDDMEDERIGEDVYQQLRFDLCSDCRKAFLQNPLGRSISKQFDFSKN